MVPRKLNQVNQDNLAVILCGDSNSPPNDQYAALQLPLIKCLKLDDLNISQKDNSHLGLITYK